jgi:hypothetical protein
MWRFGIAAILLPVLVVLAADMLLGGKESRTVADPYLPSSWHAASGGHSVAIEDGAPARLSVAAAAGNESTDVWASEIRASLARGLVDAGTRNGSGPRYDDVPPFNKEALAALPSASRSAEEAWLEDPFSEAPGLPSPAARPADATSAKRPSAGGEPTGANVASQPTYLTVGEPVPRPDLANARQIAYAQSKLAALGYDPGPADGQLGSRTEAAIRKFQKDARLPGDGRIDDRLVARLDTEVRTRAPSRPRELAAISPGAAPKTEKPRERNVFGSVLGGFQRLLGRDFDSVRRPGELAAYCRANTDTWIYDFGREAFVYCGNVVATAQVK